MEFVGKKRVVLQVHLHEILKDYYKNDFYRWDIYYCWMHVSHR